MYNVLHTCKEVETIGDTDIRFVW